MKNAIHMLESKASHRQMQSFIITTDDGKVIAIDGGRREDADYFLEYLKEITGQEIPVIDAWFLTHAHNDHLPAFFEIIQNRSSEVVVGTVFYNLPSIQYYTRIPGEEDNDGAVTTAKFFELLPLFAEKVCVASGGDTYEIGNAKFEILYSAETDIEVNICNNASLVFKMTLGGKTVMFTGDCGIEAGNKILERYKDSGILKCDICQMAHHGQEGCSREFYEAVSPKECLWCTPGWLWNNDRGKGFNTHIYQTVEVRGWMEEIGVTKNYVTMDGTQVCLL